MFWFIVICCIIIFFVLVSRYLSPVRLELNGSHVLITGGSSGIGKAMALYVVKHGASVTIVARNKIKLQEAKAEIEKCLKNSQQAENNLGPVDILINNAGTSICGVFEELDKSEFQKMMDINYIGGVYMTRAVVKSMKERNRGRIIFVSSQAGQIGLFGYTAYSASKYALRGLGEALQMEVKPYNIYVTLAFPPDTDTPGFALEQETKVKETSLISETAGLLSPNDVAQKVIEDSLNGKFLSHIGIDGYLLANITCGMSPTTSLLEFIQQVLTMSVFRLVSLFYIVKFDSIVQKCKQERESAKLKTS
ncbi:hypothetical protein KUTeg_019708 [Tegillarca granosa]|uniref:3-dehydrosphinganine reductase n=1 Tax=Tegillarca granosa TaxID=220873 RepID=A0ABQ9EIC6_TEGGR|nr:hypothetical protein KUTeg_019708 [Tegillarca granosa]